MLTKYRSELIVPEFERPIDQMSDDELMNVLNRVLDSVTHIGKASAILAYRLGKLLREVRQRPSIYQEYGSFSRFIQEYVVEKFGVSRSGAFGALRVADHWPNLTDEDIAAIGTVKLLFLSRIGSHDADPSGKYLEAARTMTYERLREWAVDKGLIDPSDGELRTLKLPRDIYEDLVALIDDPRAQSQVGSDNRFDVLRAMIAEFRGTYGI